MRKLLACMYGLRRYLIPALVCMILLFVCSGVSFSKSDGAVKKNNSPRGSPLCDLCRRTKRVGLRSSRDYPCHTADGASTWVPQQSNTKFTLGSLSFVDANNGWVVGERGLSSTPAMEAKPGKNRKAPLLRTSLASILSTPLKGGSSLSIPRYCIPLMAGRPGPFSIRARTSTSNPYPSLIH